mmetsp:Transcript_18493/g.51088  ORF Transcript_18493/g.51088 Transcript_18493/m.51088 type:complete len:248 (+) Transcript_18493:1197-1940(+)
MSCASFMSLASAVSCGVSSTVGTPLTLPLDSGYSGSSLWGAPLCVGVALTSSTAAAAWSVSLDSTSSALPELLPTSRAFSLSWPPASLCSSLPPASSTGSWSFSGCLLLLDLRLIAAPLSVTASVSTWPSFSPLLVSALCSAPALAVTSEACSSGFGVPSDNASSGLGETSGDASESTAVLLSWSSLLARFASFFCRLVLSAASGLESSGSASEWTLPPAASPLVLRLSPALTELSVSPWPSWSPSI